MKIQTYFTDRRTCPSALKILVSLLGILLGTGCAIQVNRSVSVSTGSETSTGSTTTYTAVCSGYTAPPIDFSVDDSADISDSLAGDGICDDGSGKCTLRAAIEESDALGGSLAIEIPASMTITLNATLQFSKSITIVGKNALTSVVSAGGLDHVIESSTSGETFALHNFTIQDGLSANGGGLYATGGTITLSYMNFINNTATADGGGIYISNSFATLNPTLTVSCSTFQANASVNGGGIGGGVSNLTLNDVFFLENVVSGVGGGLSLGAGNAGGVYNLNRTYFEGNKANSVTGGSIAIDGANTVTATITNSSFYGNRALQAAVIYSDNNATINFYNNTMLSNLGGGGAGDIFRINTGGVFNIANSILWNSLGPSNICSIAGTMNSLGHNIFEDSSNCSIDASDLTTDPGLGVPAANGGFTKSITITASGAADGGADSAYCPTADQRNYDRAATCDIGAYESQ